MRRMAQGMSRSADCLLSSGRRPPTHRVIHTHIEKLYRCLVSFNPAVSRWRCLSAGSNANPIVRVSEKDMLPEERNRNADLDNAAAAATATAAFASSRTSSPSSSRASSPTDSEGSDSDEQPHVDAEFAAGLEAMKARYDQENGIDRSAHADSPAGTRPMRFRTGRRAAVSIDTSEPIRADAKDKVRQAIIVSLGPESTVGQTMIEELVSVRTVQDLQNFTARNAHNLSELGQIQVEMQMSALGAWKKGFDALRGAMMFGRLQRGRQFDADGNEIQLTPEEIAAREAEIAAREAEAAAQEAAAAAEREARERAIREAADRARREQQEREEKEAAERAAERLAQEIAEKEAELARKAQATKLLEEEAERRRLAEQRQAAIEAARKARLEAIRKSRSLSGCRPIRTPKTVQRKHKAREAALIPAAKLKSDAALSQVFAGVGVDGASERPVSSQSARAASTLGGAMRTYCRGGLPTTPRASARLALGSTSPVPACALPRKGVKGSLPSVTMQRLSGNRHRVDPVTVVRPTTAPGLSHLFADPANKVRCHLVYCGERTAVHTLILIGVVFGAGERVTNDDTHPISHPEASAPPHQVDKQSGIASKYMALPQSRMPGNTNSPAACTVE
eukprot:COSAG02_NODE_761_length_17476_cov_195.233067_4_plen_623_part_00